MGQYLPVLVMLVLGAGFAGASLVMSKLVRPRPTSAESCQASNRPNGSRFASTWWP